MGVPRNATPEFDNQISGRLDSGNLLMVDLIFYSCGISIMLRKLIFIVLFIIFIVALFTISDANKAGMTVFVLTNIFYLIILACVSADKDGLHDTEINKKADIYERNIMKLVGEIESLKSEVEFWKKKTR